MPAKRSFRLHRPTALAHRRPSPPSLRVAHRATRLAIALALAMAVALTSAAASSANTGSVYFDSNNNVGAGETLFNGTFTGTGNVGLSRLVMPALTTGIFDTALGLDALHGNTSGSHNTATGTDALFLNPTGNDNTATGFWALKNTTGNSNIAIGSGAGLNLSFGNNNIDIDNPGVAGESGRIRIGTKGEQSAAYLQGVYGKTAVSGVPVLVNSAGKLGTASAKTQPLSVAAGRRLLADVKRQAEQIRRQAAELRRLRERVVGGH
jgi:hypothetical protein